MVWLDDKNTPLAFTQADGKVRVQVSPYAYGKNLVVRIAKITTK